VEVPGLIPDTIPVVEPTIATPVLPLLHVPPVVAEANVVVAPVHKPNAPVITAGMIFTVTTWVLVHPEVILLTVILAVPALMPVTTPDDDPTVAFDILLLVQ